MAKLVEGDSRGFHRGPNGITSRLPPRIPSVPSRTLLPSDVSTGLHNSQNFESLERGQREHKRTPSCNMVMHEQPVWLDDLLEDSEGSSKKVSHRRSASDSFTLLENAGGLCMLNIAEEEESNQSGTFLADTSNSRHMLINNCLTDLFHEIRQLQDQRNAPISAVTPPAVSRCEVSRMDEFRGSSAAKSGSALTPNLRGLSGQSVSLPEDKSSEAADPGCHDNTTGDANADPKKAKRQSAQRSRVRKLQYIAELERIVNALQTQVSSLSPQVLLFQQQRALLHMDNSALKQKLALCMREKSINDSQNETLDKELQRLQKLYELQVCQDLGPKQRLNRIHRHSSLPTDFGFQLRQYGELTGQSDQSEFVMPSPDVLPRLMEDLAGMSLDGQGDSRAQHGA